jgi:hypothetical protein
MSLLLKSFPALLVGAAPLGILGSYAHPFLSVAGVAVQVAGVATGITLLVASACQDS